MLRLRSKLIDAWIYVAWCAGAVVCSGCGDSGNDGAASGGSGNAGSGNAGSGNGGSGNGGSGAGTSGSGGSGGGSGAWPNQPNQYSWDGSWTPTAQPEGIFDSIYNDGHVVEGSPSPLLPPGEWDWQQTALLANWNAFSTRVGTWELLRDDAHDFAFGWRLNRATEAGVAVDAIMEYFHGSSGTDILDLGAGGAFESTGNLLYGPAVRFGDGPDMLRYRRGHSAEVRVGSSVTGAARDNDLAIIGGPGSAGLDSYDVVTTTLHTGPGRDLVFVNNFERAALDLGNGEDGRTDALDANDSGDIAVIGGNARDFRVFGGRGDDVFVWNVDEVRHSPGIWLGPNFFGGGGWGDALWGDDGVDRLVLGIPEDTTLVSSPGQVVPGSLLILVQPQEGTVIDTPTEHDDYARYYVYAPPSPTGQLTVTLQYVSADSSVDTAYFFITAVEEIQLGISATAPVYRVDATSGAYSLAADAEAFAAVPSRERYEALFASFLR